MVIQGIYRQQITRLSAAIKLQDRLSPDGSAIGTVRVGLKGTGIEASRNRSGFFFFCDILPGTYTILVESDYYKAEELTLQVEVVPVHLPQLNITLQPNRTYPFPEGVAQLRAVVRSTAGDAVAKAAVTGVNMQALPTVKAKLSELAANGTSQLKLTNIQGNLNAGDYIYIRDTITAYAEYCRLIAPLPVNAAEEPYFVAAPLRADHLAQSSVHTIEQKEMVQAVTDGSGEFVIPFPYMSMRRTLVQLEITAAGYRSKRLEAEIIEGSTVSLSAVSLSSL